jgi:hypothetical protein
MEWREPGKTGEPGWTKEAKMPQWESREADKAPAATSDSKKLRRGNG